MENKSNSHGRTIFDLISENPKKALYIFIGIVILFLAFLLMGNSLKVGSVELNGKEKIVHDTIVKVIRDTIIIEKPTVVTKYIKPTKKTSDIEVSDKNTEIKVSNQPANINTGNNSGILGNNNTVNVNEKPLVLNDVDKHQLITLLEQTIKKNSLKHDICIELSGLGSDSRSFQMAGIILDFLKSKKYNADGISQKWYNKPIKGIEIIYNKKCIEVNVLII